jgi:hypothetical protein
MLINILYLSDSRMDYESFLLGFAASHGIYRMKGIVGCWYWCARGMVSGLMVLGGERKYIFFSGKHFYLSNFDLADGMKGICE